MPENKDLGLFFYNIFLALYAAGIRIAALTNKKAALWLAGRKNIFSTIAAWRKKNEGDLVWMHCASLGEFEQGRPVIEMIRQKNPHCKILLTFFSPSGYEIRKNYAGADGVFYLPPDSKKNAARFIELVDPSLVIWVKYEYWYYYLNTLHQNNIPVVLISALFRETQPFFKSYGGIWKKMLGCFHKIFVQNESSLNLLRSISLAGNAAVAGDTRFDRVITIVAQHADSPVTLMDFCRGHKVIVAGSTWQEDEEELVHYVKVHPQIKFIIAPHEIDKERLADAKKLFRNAVFYSEYKSDSDVQVIIVDNIGMLAGLYALADITYVGGGFNDKGIHNILEAGVYGKPVIFGPQYERSSEAIDLLELKGAFSISNALELEALLDKLFGDEELLRDTGAVTKKYIYGKTGAAEMIVNYLYEKRLLTS